MRANPGPFSSAVARRGASDRGGSVLGRMLVPVLCAGLMLGLLAACGDRPVASRAEGQVLQRVAAATPAITSLTSLRNARDASTSSDGKVLLRGVLYRSAAPSGLTKSDRSALARILGADGVIIDLRTRRQRAAAPDVTLAGVEDLRVPIASVRDQRPMVTDAQRRAQLGVALRDAARATGPVLVHCSLGKDRTGWMVAMIMYVGGANDSQVMSEYLKSRESGFALKAAWLRDGLRAARSRYGTIRGYLRNGVGLTKLDLAQLGRRFTV